MRRTGRAVTHPRIELRVARADSTGLSERSVNLVTVAQALHWFDTRLFFAEAKRVLTEDGALAGYLRTWSATARYVKQHGLDPVDSVEQSLALQWGDPRDPREVRWPLYIRAGRL